MCGVDTKHVFNAVCTLTYVLIFNYLLLKLLDVFFLKQKSLHVFVKFDVMSTWRPNVT